MKSVIWKFPLKVSDYQLLEIPIGSVILSIQTQNEIPSLWALIYNINAPKETIKLRTIGTGISIEMSEIDVRDFLGTYQLKAGRYVYHVFQCTK